MILSVVRVKQAIKEEHIRILLKLQPELIEDWDSVDIVTVKGCNKCYGRGFVGKNTDGIAILCSCLRVNFK